MSPILKNQPFRFEAKAIKRLRRSLVGVFLFLPAMAGLAAETVTPLVAPAVNPGQENAEEVKKPDPVLGFTPLPAGNPPASDGLSVLPSDPSNKPLMDDLVDPLTQVDLPKLPDDPFSIENISASNLNSLPILHSGGDFGANIDQSWLSGFSNAPSSVPMGMDLLETLREGFSFSAMLNAIYDTNPSQGYGTAANSGEGDFFTTFGGTLSYRSIASEWTYGATYTGSYNQYFNQTELSGYNQNASALLNYEGGSFNIGFTLGVDFGSGANRNYESVVDELSYNYGLNARYRFSEKTSLMGNVSQSITSASGNTDTSSLDISTSALWAYSPLTEFGPGVRYTLRTGDSQPDRSSLGPTFAVNYQVAQKVSLNSVVGMDFVSYDGNSSADSSLFSSIGLNYRASAFWGMSFSLLRDVEASYSNAGEFEETTALRIGYNRSIRRAVWTLGLGLENRVSNNPNPLIPAQPDRNYFTFDTGLGMPIFSGTTHANVFIRYSDLDSGGPSSWDSMQIGCGLNRKF
jgi:hypothetical protein